MAIKDPNVLDRINTLNTNLENANIAEVEKNISTNLFNVLEGANSISVDSELYASINNVANVSALAAFINRNKNSLPHNPADRIQINYVGGAYHVANTIVNLPTTAGIADTETAIRNMENALKLLDSPTNNLSSQIATLRTRLQENRRILNDIHNIQSDARWTGRTVVDINNDITINNSNVSTCRNLLNILTRIQNAEQHPAYSNPTHAQHMYYVTLHTNEVNNFNALISGVSGVTNYITDGDFVSKRSEVTIAQTNYENDIRNLQQELRLSEDTMRNTNRLPTSNIVVPNNLGLFNTNDTIVDRTTLTDATQTQNQINDVDARLAQLDVLEGQIETLRKRYQDNLNKLNKILKLQQLQESLNTNHAGLIDIRHEEFQAIQEISYSNLLLGPAIVGRPRPAGSYIPTLPNTNITVGGTTPTVVPLNFIHGTGLVRPGHFDYTLCNSDGTPLRINGGKFECQVGGQTISIKGINFVNNNVANQTMTINNLQVSPIEGLTFPLILDLNVRVRIHDNATGRDIDHHKPIHLEITRPTLLRANRENAYDSLVPPMNDRVEAEYTDRYRESLENEAIRNILREGGNEKEVNEIYNNETRREMLIDRIRTALSGSFPLLSLAALQAGFRNDMTREDRDVPVQYLLGETEFQNYIRQDIPKNLKDYASKTIHDNANAHRNELLNEFLIFQTDIVNNRKDNNDNINILNSIPPERPEGHPNTFFQRLIGQDSIQNNYTKFFQGRHAELKDLSLETEDGTIKYGVKVEVSGVNKLTATINIDGKEDPEIIDAPNHEELIAGILNMANTKDGEPVNKKLLCNVALSVLKAMVLMSPQKLSRDIQYLNPAQRTFYDEKGNPVVCDRMEAFVRGGNLRIRGAEVDGSRTRHNVVIFDEARFKNLYDENMLEDGIRTISTQISSIMNATAQEYHEATSAMLRNDGNRYVMRYDTAQRLRGGPIKRLWGRMIHGKTSNDFDFDNVSVNEAGKSVNIKLNKGKFTVTGEFDGQQYEYKGRNLGSILRKKINRKRVFDGVELAMLAAINEAFVTKLRENHWVQTENFIISDINDGKTGKTYIFDSAGNLSYLEIEDINLNPLGAGQSGRVDPNQIPAARKRCNKEERREFMQNPLLAGRLQRAMRRRLALF